MCGYGCGSPGIVADEEKRGINRRKYIETKRVRAGSYLRRRRRKMTRQIEVSAHTIIIFIFNIEQCAVKGDHCFEH